MKENIQEITTEKLLYFIENKRGSVIDIRPMAAYNGWPLQQEARGGHIQSAKSIPLSWTRYMDWVEVPGEKKVSQNEPVVIYGYENDNIRDMAAQLAELGFLKVLVYSQFTGEWAAHSNLPMQRLARYKQLVYPEWVSQLINDKNPPGFDGGSYVVCHFHYGYLEDYQKGHIPGASALET